MVEVFCTRIPTEISPEVAKLKLFGITRSLVRPLVAELGVEELMENLEQLQATEIIIKIRIVFFMRI